MPTDGAFFLDTSALVKHYHDELGSDTVNQLWEDYNSRLFISRLALLEMTSALGAKHRAGHITLEDFTFVHYRFLADVGDGRPQAVSLTKSHYQVAQDLLRQHSPTEPIRTLDALQLSAALLLDKQQRLEGFVAADRHLLRLAKQNDLPILNPEEVSR